MWNQNQGRITDTDRNKIREINLEPYNRKCRFDVVIWNTTGGYNRVRGEPGHTSIQKSEKDEVIFNIGSDWVRIDSFCILRFIK